MIIIIIIKLAHMQNQEQDFCPYYTICPPWALSYYKGKSISIIGKVVNVNESEEQLQLEIDPQFSNVIKVIIKPFDMRYLLKDEDANDVLTQEDDTIIDKYIKSNKGNRQNVSNEPGQINSVDGLWYMVNKNDFNKTKSPQKSSQPAQTLQSSAQTLKQPAKLISAATFSIGQYLQIRGECINQSCIKMQQFTDYEYNYDLKGHNTVLKLAIQHCQDILY